jgi:hypothetical protein
MKKYEKNLVVIIFLLITGSLTYSQNVNLLEMENKMESVNAIYTQTIYEGKKSIRVTPDSVRAEAKFIKLNTDDFTDGIIEIDVAGMRKADAGKAARGFVGVAFRISDDNSQFECVYVRPTNGRSNDQQRRNHSVQYISFPDFPWHKLRKETPGKYETYADLVEGEWTKLRIEIFAEKAEIFINGVEQPTLIINDLKHGANRSGKIGLWVGSGTVAYFSNLSIKTVNK